MHKTFVYPCFIVCSFNLSWKRSIADRITQRYAHAHTLPIFLFFLKQRLSAFWLPTLKLNVSIQELIANITKNAAIFPIICWLSHGIGGKKKTPLFLLEKARNSRNNMLFFYIKNEWKLRRILLCFYPWVNICVYQDSYLLFENVCMVHIRLCLACVCVLMYVCLWMRVILFVVLVAQISLILSRHSSLSFIASGRSSGLHPVSSHSCWMYVRAGRPVYPRPCVGVHRSTSLMSSSLLLQQCPACLVRLTWIVFVIGGRCPYSWCLVGCCRQDLFKSARSNLV